MKKHPVARTTKGSSDIFTGDVWITPVVNADVSPRIRVSVVRFAPGARNAWHAHALGQTLHVTDGVGRTQSRGEGAIELRAGDTVVAAPGEWHWHGAAPDHFMTHLAIWEVAESGVETEWGAQLTDEEYSRSAGG